MKIATFNINDVNKRLGNLIGCSACTNRLPRLRYQGAPNLPFGIENRPQAADDGTAGLSLILGAAPYLGWSSTARISPGFPGAPLKSSFPPKVFESSG
jgi:hypothetical protein